MSKERRKPFRDQMIPLLGIETPYPMALVAWVRRNREIGQDCKDRFHAWLSARLAEIGARRFAYRVGVTADAVHKWRSGEAFPDSDSRFRIAVEFGPSFICAVMAPGDLEVEADAQRLMARDVLKKLAQLERELESSECRGCSDAARAL